MRYNFVLIISLFFLASCSPKLTVSWTDKNYEPRSYSKIAVVGTGKDLKARIEFEESAVKLFQERGINAIAGIDVFPDKMMEGEKRAEKFIKIIRENNLDGVITMSLVDTDEVTRFESGDDYIVPMGYARFGDYYYRRYTTIRSPGYYISANQYLIEAVLYDLQGELYEGKETLVWKGQSAVVDPSSSGAAAKKFTKEMVNSMVSKGIVRPGK